MMDKYKNIVSDCEKISKKFNDTKTITYLKDAKTILEGDVAGKILFFGQQADALVNVVKEIIGDENLSNLSLKYVDRAFKLNFIFGEKFICKNISNREECKIEQVSEIIMNSDKEQVLEFTIELNSELLEKISVTVMYSYRNFAEYDWNDEFSKTEFGFLLSNSTMAMNQEEREVLAGCCENSNALHRIGVFLTNINYLNTIEELNDVVDSVSRTMKQIGLNTDLLYYDAEKLAKYIRNDICGNISELKEMRNVQLVVSCVNAIEQMIDEKEKYSSLNIEELKELIKEIEEKKEHIIKVGHFAGKDAAARIRLALSDDFMQEVREYNTQVFEQISKKVNSTQDITTITDDISRYIQRAWMKFENEKKPEMDNKVNEILEQIYEQMKIDVDSFFVDVSEEKRELLETIYDMLSIEHNSRFAFETITATDSKINKASKIMLLAAIPIALIGTFTAGIVTAAGAIVLKKIGNKKLIEENKEKLIKELDGIRSTAEYDICDSFTKEIDNVANKVNVEVEESYKKFADTLLLKLKQLLNEVEKTKDILDEIKKIKTVTIPEIRNKIY